MRDQGEPHPAQPSPQEAGQAHHYQAGPHVGQRVRASGAHTPVSAAAPAEKADQAAAEKTMHAPAEKAEQAPAEKAEQAPAENAPAEHAPAENPEQAAAHRQADAPSQFADRASLGHRGDVGQGPGSYKYEWLRQK